MKRKRDYEINIQRINKYMADNYLTKTEFAKLCNISLNTLGRILNKGAIPRISTIYRMARLMDVQMYELLIPVKANGDVIEE